ncbi:acetyltransferase [Vibrio cholerae]|nr:acetyltransferase [Vibrio cholerae]MDA5326777.1 acetyltransferase [Vibrio cholerae]HDI3286870.1 acetyltransferase [Vibrio cholerae]
MVSVVAIEFSVMRCQPLRRALCVFLESFHSSALIIQT